MFDRRLYFLLAVSIVMAACAFSQTGTVLILHTNDLHDHLRPDPDGIGGMPYVSAYIQGVKAERPDTLVLDAGDALEKGDMVSFVTEGRVMYEAMGRAGYDAVAIGNHDYHIDDARLREYAELAGFSFLCINWLDTDGAPRFAPSRVFDADGVKVGVIGATILKTRDMLDVPETAKRIAAEAERLAPETHLIVVTAHLGSKECAEIARQAPGVSVFFSGHTHEVIQTPVVVPETGALIVQAGHYGQHIGHLELAIDLAAKKVTSHEYRLVRLLHEEHHPDEEMIAWLRREEKKHCPEALEVLGDAARPVSRNDTARLVAAALLHRTEADVALCHPSRVLRTGIPRGEIDANAIFRAGGNRSQDWAMAEMTGAELAGYIGYMVTTNKGQPFWAGFEAVIDRREGVTATDLEADTRYRVALSMREWTSILGDWLQRQRRAQGGPAGEMPKIEALDFFLTEAVVSYFREEAEEGEAIDRFMTRLPPRVSALAGAGS
jgi:2',3'-cyclic-nucleotide 2'-phosphodiesterase (5'-nucleotidase family)